MYGEKKLVGQDLTFDDHFGSNVAISGDVAAGAAPEADVGNTDDAGAVYLFNHTGSGWTETVKLTAGDVQEDARFGRTLSLHGDTLAVGAPKEDAAAEESGAVYVFEKGSSAQWAQVAKLVPSDAEAWDHFGRGLAVEDQVLVAGARHDDDLGTSSGSAYVFTRTSDGNWTEAEKLLAWDGAPGDRLGRSVAIENNLVLVGAQSDDAPEDDSGSVYTFQQSEDGSWNDGTKLVPSDSERNDLFGNALSMDGDTAVIGAYFDSEGDASGGAAYIFTLNPNGTWTERRKLLPPEPQDSGHFGVSVSIKGETAAIGHYRFDESTDIQDVGEVLLYARNQSGVWSLQERIMASDRRPGDWLGIDVAIHNSTLISGANKDDLGDRRDAGSAYIHRLNQIPEPDFEHGPKDPSILTPVQFTDRSSDDKQIVSWFWEFGDGNTSQDQNPRHRYSQCGTYNVTLTVTDNEGASAQITRPIRVSLVTVNPPDHEPISLCPVD